jgi:hypothetical protein
MEGVYTTPPLPDYLDLKTASDATLLQHGLLLQRPRPGDHPDVAAAWDDVCERGLQVITPLIEPMPDSMPRVRKRPRPSSSGSQATSINWCGCVLQGSGNWSSVTGTFRLPYLNIPSQGLQGNQPSALSAWVGLDGWESMELFQAIMNFNLNTATSPPSAFFNFPTWQWWVPDPNDPYASQYFGGGTIKNAPAMKSGDRVQLHCGYVTAHDGANWGSVYFLFYNDLRRVYPIPIRQKDTAEIIILRPVLMNFLFPGPASPAGQGGCVEWIMENESVTNDQTGTIMPMFSGSKDSVTPVTFTQALGYGKSVGVTGDPVNGFTVLWGNSSGQVSDVASVTLASETVSITYTGP